MADRPIRTFLKTLGITGDASHAVARRVLEHAGYTRPGRVNMSRSKEPAATEELRSHLVFHCSREECRRAVDDASGLEPVLVEQHACSVCGGSANRAALDKMGRALFESGMSRVLVVGGTSAQYTQIREIGPPGVDWRYVDGTNWDGRKSATPDAEWADVIAIWASTPLPHKVSNHYSGNPHAVTVPTRGIAALAGEVTKFAELRRRAHR